VRKLAALLSLLVLLTACAPAPAPQPDTENYHYTYEVGVTNSAGEHVAVEGDNMIIQGSGSHKGTPGIYANGQTVMPFVDRGPCAAGSPCWTGTVTVPRDGAHEWKITATVTLTPARWRIMFDEGGTHQIYCSVKLEGVPVSNLDGTGVGYAITPIQEVGMRGAEFQVSCSGHN
jgi:hypothetical protein